MLDNLIDGLKKNKAYWNRFQNLFQEQAVPAKTVLLNEGEIAQYLYLIKKGCLRLWFNNEGKDITFQFFFENQAVASLESFLRKQPSLFYLESIEPTTVVMLSRTDFELLLNHYPGFKEGFQEILFQRLGNYTRLFLSRIKDTPQKRYKELLKNNPEIILRVPQHYIASYLGITPISLSRIRNKK